MGAMTKLDLSSNDMCAEGIKLIAGALKGNQAMTELNISSTYAGRVSKYGAYDMSGIIVLTEVIKDMGALSKLSLKDNRLCTKEAGKVLAAALMGNSVLKELDVSSNYSYYHDQDQGDGPGFAQELAVGLIDNGAMSSFTFGEQQAVTMTTTMTEMDFSGKELCVSEAIMISAFLPKCT
jgi:hypothetical protein